MNKKKRSDNSQKRVISATIFTAISVLAFTLFVSVIQDNILTYAESPSSDLPNSTLFVTGSATSHAKSDKVIVSLGVETTNSTAEEALTSNSNLMKKVLTNLKEAGVQENETSTSSFTINPNYNYSEYGTRGDLIGFTVSNSIQVDSSNIDQVSRWIDTAVKAGANNINNVYFSLSDSKLEEIKDSLFKESVTKAKMKADIVASAAGMNIVGIKSIAVGGIGSPPPIMPFPGPSFTAKSIGSEADSSTPILEGEHEVSVSVSIIYFLDR